MKCPQEFAYLNYSCLCASMSRASGAAVTGAALLASSRQCPGQGRAGGCCSAAGTLAEAREGLEITMHCMKNCARLSLLPVPRSLEVCWARVSVMGSLMSWNCGRSWTRVVQKWSWRPGDGLGDLFEYKEGDFSCLPEEVKPFSRQCSYLVAWPERLKCQYSLKKNENVKY